jgi:TonB family protein
MKTHTPITAGTGLVAAFLVFATMPAAAATRVTFGPLVPTAAINAIDKTATNSSCTDPDANARVTDAYPSQWLKAVAAQSAHGSAQVKIDLDSMGNLLQASIVRSSGNALLDDQALVAARGSKYAPEVHNCSSFKRSYFLDVNFESQSATLPQVPGVPGRQPVK